jgi:hypothetical protein
MHADIAALHFAYPRAQSISLAFSTFVPQLTCAWSVNWGRFANDARFPGRRRHSACPFFLITAPQVVIVLAMMLAPIWALAWAIVKFRYRNDGVTPSSDRST